LRCRFDCKVHVSIFENDDGVLSTHLALDLRTAPRCLFVESNADAVRSGEGNSFDGWMIDYLVACL
jgi:hypothetical protein